MREHIRITAWLHIALGGLTLLGGVFLFFLFSGMAGVAATQSSHDAAPVAAILAGLGVFFLFIIALFSLPNLILGWGLLQRAPWARVVGIVISLLGLLHPAIGIGTLINIYSLWVFFQPETIALFDRRSTSPLTY